MSFGPNSRSGGGGAQKGGGRRHENNRIYANPLPLLFVEPPPSRIGSILGLLGLSLTRVENPHCEGIFDPVTRSVWVSNPDHSLILWRRGFFGKGDLSRSEPSWLARQINIRKSGGKQLTSEEVTARRRAERKQFKLDRARAIAAVAEEAETIFATEGRVIQPALSGPAIPSAATWKPSPQPVIEDSVPEAPQEEGHPDEEEALVDVEHLQLTLQEAFFFLWNLDCLTVLDPNSLNPMSLDDIWLAFQRADLPPVIPPSPSASLQFDNPFLINYVVYHHYRSLGWVVKGGVKFCVDYLLYKRGPVFTHAELALVVLPVYEDPEDQISSSIQLQNSSPFAWSWLSTINRVNSQVQKTLILVYVTIPAKSRLSPDVLLSPACLAHYSVREVILRRFIPARGDLGMALLPKEERQPVAMVFGGLRHGPYATCTPLKALLDKINQATGSQVFLRPPIHHIFQAKPYPADFVEHLTDLETGMLEPETQQATGERYRPTCSREHDP